MQVVNEKQKPPSKREQRLAQALKRNIARRKAVKKSTGPKKT
jgi:hypothetical protein